MCTLTNNGTAPFIKSVSKFSLPGRAVLSGKRPRHGRDDCLRGRRRECILPRPVNLTESKARAANQRACTPRWQRRNRHDKPEGDHTVSRTAGSKGDAVGMAWAVLLLPPPVLWHHGAYMP